MPQLLDRSQVSTTIAVPLDLIEAETLSLLGVEIIDIQDNIDDCIPQGDIRYWVQRGETELLGVFCINPRKGGFWKIRFSITPLKPLPVNKRLSQKLYFLRHAHIMSLFMSQNAILRSFKK